MAEPTPQGEKRLNPFAFPAETGVRFTLLLVAALMVIINLATLPMIQLFGYLERTEEYQANLDLNNAELERIDAANQAGTLSPAESIAQLEALYRDIIAHDIEFAVDALLPVAGLLIIIALVFATAWFFYRRHPQRIRRRAQLETLPPHKYRNFQATVQDLAAQAGVNPPPSLEITAGSNLADGQVFGLRKRYSLRIGGGIPVQMVQNPAATRATLLHEMAHITNRDVGSTYYTQAIWLAVLILGVLPFFLYILGLFVQSAGRRIEAVLAGTDPNWFDFLRFSLPQTSYMIVQLFLTVIVLALIRASVLRVREYYADWRAALWGSETGLLSILSANAETEQYGVFKRLFQLHPSAQERLDTLRAPERLFTITPGIPLFAGILVAFTLTGMVFLSLTLTMSLGLMVVNVVSLSTYSAGLNGVGLIYSAAFFVMWIVFWLPVIAAMYLVANALGLQVQRQIIAEQANAEKSGCGTYLRLAWPAFLFALGAQAGFYIVPGISIFARVGDLLSYEGPIGPVLTVPVYSMAWVLGYTILIWLWLVVTRLLGSKLLSAHTGNKPPLTKHRILMLVLGLLLGIVTLPAVIAQGNIFSAFTDTAFILPGIGWTLLAIAVGAFIFVTGGIWLTIVLWNRLVARRCPVCNHKTSRQHVIGQGCTACGSELAAWVFIEEPG